MISCTPAIMNGHARSFIIDAGASGCVYIGRRACQALAAAARSATGGWV